MIGFLFSPATIIAVVPAQGIAKTNGGGYMVGIFTNGIMTDYGWECDGSLAECLWMAEMMANEDSL